MLFDFNGVLVHDEPVHWRALREALAPLGLRISWSRYRERYLMGDDATAIRRALADAGQPSPGAGEVARLVRAKRRAYRRRIGSRLRFEAGAARFVRGLEPGPLLAIVSSATRSEIRAAVRASSLARRFETVVSGDDVARTKPHPDPYRTALRALGVPAREALAFEDSPGGIASARGAGLRVIGVSTSWGAAALRRAGASAVVARLGGLDAAAFAAEGRLRARGSR